MTIRDNARVRERKSATIRVQSQVRASWPGTCRLWRLEPYRHTQFSVSLEIVLNALAGYFRPVFASVIYFHEARPRLCAVVKRDLCVAVPGYMGSGKSRTVKEAADAVNPITARMCRHRGYSQDKERDRGM